jgi:hypothetical protein
MKNQKPKGPKPYRKPSKDQIMLRWKVRPVAKAVAYVVRAHSNADGYAKVPFSQFMKEVNATHKSVTAAIAELDQAGVLAVKPAASRWEASTYRLHHNRNVYEKKKSTKHKQPVRKKKTSLKPSQWSDVVSADSKK